VVGQLGQMPGRAVGGQMAEAGADGMSHRRQSAGNQRRVLEVSDPHSQVEVLGQQNHLPVVEVEVEDQVWVSA
jgi:hypothetical protein